MQLPAAAAPAFYAPVADVRTGILRRGFSGMLVAALHVLLLFVLAYVAMRPESVAPTRTLAVRMIEAEAPQPPKIEPPRPVPAQPVPRKLQKPLPVMTAARRDDAPSAFAVAPQAEPVASPAAPAVMAPPAPIVAARFDADYLQNPKPVYPPMSRRLGEEGKLVLRVRVSSQGLPLSVEVSRSSGFQRLDEAGRAAVERWRFVPARQGDQAVEASVLVPLNFTLNS